MTDFVNVAEGQRIYGSKIDANFNKISADWTGFTPGLSNPASMEIDSLVVNLAAYKIIGKVVHLHIDVSFTTGGTAGNQIDISIPSAIAPPTNAGGGCFLYDSTSGIEAGIVRVKTDDKINVYKYNASNWTLGPAREIEMAISYKLA